MISAVINTYNEEANIERCLSSLTSFADEIVIVDMGSTDRTIDKAKEFNAKIYTHPYTGFVEPARNYALEKTSGDWIFLIDADEDIPKTLKTLLKNKIKTPTKSFYRIPRKNIIFGRWIKHAYWWPDYQIRFFKKGSVLWSDKIHSIPMTRGEGFDIPPVEENAIIHYNYQSIFQFIERLNRYTNIQAKELYIEGYKFHWSDVIKKPTDEFLSRFFEGEGYKDGLHGLTLSFLQGLSMLVLYAKIWELEGLRQENIKLTDLEKELTDRNNKENYWIIQEKLKTDPSLLSKIKLKLEKKIISP